MNATFVEAFLEKRLKRLFGKKIKVNAGPLVVSKLSGIHPEIAVWVNRVEDFGGLMPDGSHTKRRRAQGTSTFKGYEEERPGRLSVTVSCIAGTYKLTQQICDMLSPAVLLALEMLPRFPLGTLPDDSVTLYFEDFISNFHAASIGLRTEEDFSFYQGDLVFHMNGFIHVWLTKRGGFSSARYNKSGKRNKVNESPPEKPKPTRKKRKTRKRKSA